METHKRTLENAMERNSMEDVDWMAFIKQLDRVANYERTELLRFVVTDVHDRMPILCKLLVSILCVRNRKRDVYNLTVHAAIASNLLMLELAFQTQGYRVWFEEDANWFCDVVADHHDYSLPVFTTLFHLYGDTRLHIWFRIVNKKQLCKLFNAIMVHFRDVLPICMLLIETVRRLTPEKWPKLARYLFVCTNSPLLEAAIRRGHFSMVRYITEELPSLGIPASQFVDGQTCSFHNGGTIRHDSALSVAVQTKHVDIAKYLYERSALAKKYQSVEGPITELIEDAASSGSLPMLQWIITERRTRDRSLGFDKTVLFRILFGALGTLGKFRNLDEPFPEEEYLCLQLLIDACGFVNYNVGSRRSENNLLVEAMDHCHPKVVGYLCGLNGIDFDQEVFSSRLGVSGYIMELAIYRKMPASVLQKMIFCGATVFPQVLRAAVHSGAPSATLFTCTDGGSISMLTSIRKAASRCNMFTLGYLLRHTKSTERGEHECLTKGSLRGTIALELARGTCDHCAELCLSRENLCHNLLYTLFFSTSLTHILLTECDRSDFRLRLATRKQNIGQEQ